MNFEDFISEKIKKLISDFRYIEIYYIYKETTNTHFVKIIPEDVFRTKEFSIVKATILKDFIKNNFSGLLSFISEDSPVKLSGATKICSNFENIKENRESWNRNYKNNSVFCVNNFSLQLSNFNSKAA